MKKIVLAVSLLATFLYFIECNKDKEDKSGNDIIKLVVTADKDYEVSIDGTNATLFESLPNSATEVTIKTLEISNNATVDKSVGTKIAVGTALTIVVTAENGDISTYTLTIPAHSTLNKNIRQIIITDGTNDYIGKINGKTISFPALPNYKTNVTLKKLIIPPTTIADKKVNDAVSFAGDTIIVTAKDDSAKTYTLKLTTSKSTSDFFIHIPDTNFRNKIITNSQVNNSDVSGTYIRLVALERITNISAVSGNIKSLSGVGYMKSLTSLNLHHNPLSALDFSKNSYLTYLNVVRCSLTFLNVSNISSLIELWAQENSLTSLDVSTHSSLNRLSVADNYLTAFDVSTNNNLTEFLIWGNYLTALDISTNTSLTGLWAYQNSLTALDVSIHRELNHLSVFQNSLTTLDVSTNTELTSLFLFQNSLTDLDISSNTSLTRLNIMNNSSLTCIQTATGNSILHIQKEDTQTLSTSCD